MVTANLTITQNAISPGAGVSMIGVGGLPVTLSNASNDGVERWIYELLDVPLDSTLVPGILSSGTTPTISFVPDSSPDTPGCYKIRLTVVGTDRSVSSQTRNFAVRTAKGWILPSYCGERSDLNFAGNPLGWKPYLNRAFLDLSKIPVIPSIPYDTSITDAERDSEIEQCIEPVQATTTKCSAAVFQIEPPVTAVEAYTGAVYSPCEDAIYYLPERQALETTWHKINCKTGMVEDYTVAGTVGVFYGGAYHPSLNRIYLSPGTQATELTWIYIDCYTGQATSYVHGATAVAEAYAGAVYSPSQNRLYFVPYEQAPETQWHYVDAAGTVVAYTHGATAVASAYFGGVYSPTQDRIYLVPYAQVGQPHWHYIDCKTGAVVAYAHGQTIAAASFGYLGGVYSPTQNRIYLVPDAVATETHWHYIDCETGNVVAYAHGATVLGGYEGGAYVPTLNRIYLSPASQAEQDEWHYIDCNDGSVVAYNGLATLGAYCSGACYSPTEDRVYFSPYSQVLWPYVQLFSDKKVARNLTAGPIFNKL